MNQKVPYNIKSIDFNNIILKTPKNIKNKKVIFLKYTENKCNNNFVIQLSKLENNIFMGSSEIECDINNKEQINFINNLDDYIISLGKENSTEWFSHVDDKSSIDYQRILQYNNSIKLKLVNNENFKTIVSLNSEIIEDFNDLDNISSSSKILLEVYAIWIKNNSFGLLLRPVNIALTYINSYNYNFINESTSDSDDNNSELFLKNFNIKSSVYEKLESEMTSDDDNSENDLNKIILG